jgi:murein DD-endopeptidase MepM/ murein hydrolase activator NlpD
MQKLLLLFLISLPWIASATNNPDTGENDSSVVTEETAVTFFDTASVYTVDWNNDVTFRYPEANFNPEGAIPLIDSIFGYAFPIEKETTSGFGGRRRHKGVDIPLKVGEDVVAAFGGKVRYAKWNSGGFGNLVIIRHPNGLETYYAHLSKLNVKPNQVVQAGELIGLGGSTGRSYSPHLHFEVRYNHIPFDPKHIFDLENYCLKTDSIALETIIKRSKGQMCHDHVEIDESGHDHDHGAQASKNTSSTAPAVTGDAKYHTVRSGDTLSKIGAKHGRSVGALCNLNGLSKTSVLQIGQKIRVK